jgi:hypothetical protein
MIRQALFTRLPDQVVLLSPACGLFDQCRKGVKPVM